jgi:hypothetical protein
MNDAAASIKIDIAGLLLRKLKIFAAVSFGLPALVFVGFLAANTPGFIRDAGTPQKSESVPKIELPKATEPAAPRFDKPADIPATPIATEDNVSKAWDGVRSSDDISDLTAFASKFPDTEEAKIALTRVDEIVNAGGLKIAGLGDEATLIGAALSYKSLRKEPTPTGNKLTYILEDIIKRRDFPEKYPLGFAVFYATGVKVLHYGVWRPTPFMYKIDTKEGIYFDPSLVKVTLTDKTVCLDKLPFRTDNGDFPIHLSDVCFGGNGSIMHAVTFGKVAELDIEPLGTSRQGLAWVVGLRQPYELGPN